MTRFMMTLEDAVNLVFFALENAEQGDILVQKSPSASLEDIVLAIEKLNNKKLSQKIIGTRHGEKLFEDLISGEELLRSKEQDNYFTIKMDMRNLNYNNYLNQGISSKDGLTSYNSHNTIRLDQDQIIDLLKKSGVIND